MSVQLEPSWKEELQDEFEKPYMKTLKAFLQEEKATGQTVYPPGNLIFNAFNHTPFDKVKVVIIGQDPYHGKNQAHGLSFSVQKGVTIPPSLRSIYKELQDDIPGFTYPPHGELTKWADQGVLLLNATLTVRAGQPASHQKKGWEEFTDNAIQRLSAKREGIIFLLWGKFAQSKALLIDSARHTVLKAAHPSPYSANDGFFGCKHFSKTNAILEENGKTGIDWQIV
ncbi:uracil-DNA glycosylase [Hufsiella ginkgonis]|uniref:Uracil-DNA glycosylase n=1 Tax=Hufsiella ginkgonis TaxID=2695274 RepID=A0A7K1XYL1_9SPHI|nr:uracil-DNA glycosylase [Hufsiella ginkgonis]MXV15918.1 uracil-DNA glycosylase [Hufsiella ginkgonis]